MIEEAFNCQIQHAPCRNNLIECSNCEAFKIDDSDGLAASLGFSNAALSKVDYFHKNADQIVLIEVTDLDDQLRNLQPLIEKASKVTGTSKLKKDAMKNAWLPLTSEFKQKWGGSIAVIERLYRKNGLLVADPDYQLLIVCKNGTDTRMLEALCSRLEGMVGNVKICDTNSVNDNLN